jgi:hypothetical protein
LCRVAGLSDEELGGSLIAPLNLLTFFLNLEPLERFGKLPLCHLDRREKSYNLLTNHKIVTLLCSSQ